MSRRRVKRAPDVDNGEINFDNEDSTGIYNNNSVKDCDGNHLNISVESKQLVMAFNLFSSLPFYFYFLYRSIRENASIPMRYLR